MNNSETLFIERIEDEVIIADVFGGIHAIGYTECEAIEDALCNGVCPEDLEGLWDDDHYCEEDYL